MNKTIVALATPPYNGAIHIIRVSGPNAYEIVNSICKNEVIKSPNTVQINEVIKDGLKIDQVVLVKFVGPKSFTGEDLVEINCHGGVFLASMIIQLLIEKGCSMAQRGEFTRRALENDKIDISQAHSINNLVNSTNETAVVLSNKLLTRNNSELFWSIKKNLISILAKIEVSIDYPEFDESPSVMLSDLEILVKNQIISLDRIINNYRNSTKFFEGFTACILGKPNSGKSSLLNCLINEDKAIVSNIPGTTRDIVEGTINIRGSTIKFLDTAGIRNTSDEIENQGIRKAKELMKNSNIVIYVIDKKLGMTKQDEQNISEIDPKKIIIVFNKSDENSYEKQGKIFVSAKNNSIEPLIEKLIHMTSSNGLLELDTNDFINNNYHLELLLELKEELENMIVKTKEYGAQVDLLTIYLSKSIRILDRSIGKLDNDALLNEMFSKFCLGK
jgi:tRNA modification GTPase